MRPSLSWGTAVRVNKKAAAGRVLRREGSEMATLFAGVDPTASAARKTACALLDERPTLVALERLRTDEEIVSFVSPAKWVGLDAPCTLPRGMDRCCLEEPRRCGCSAGERISGRQAERELLREGIRAYFISPNMFARNWVLQGLRLKDRLEQHGLSVLEVFPNGTKQRLFGRSPFKKSTKPGRIWAQEHLGLWVANLPVPDDRLLSHDELDAVLAALTVWLHDRGL
ncbi:MAG TPA: DUF429 domain-containing protein, partial [Bacteroidetes bacterium]|nr:DUF429 domain-containing protein [Bacteroidota bacterium]